jgi:carbamoyl-phosphate synthase / aspartate carbamoyltransferase / dihydroorotase
LTGLLILHPGEKVKITMSNIIRLPGLIDTHVHLREPGSTHKEDFETGTKSAIAGGYTLVLDMPNNPEPTITPESVENKAKLAHNRIYSDLGFHFGATAQSSMYFEEVREKIFGLKVYMNHTTGPLLIEDADELNQVFSAWPKDKPLMVHAEEQTIKTAIDLANAYKNKLHICHIARRSELELIQRAKEKNMKITCEVSMHHLYLTEEDVTRLGQFGMMRPPLTSKEDLKYLWENINDIDIIASDHAPHTKEEKQGENVVNGVPGLETSLVLLLNAVNEGKLTIERVIEMTHKNPKKIFSIPEQKDTFVEVDLDEEHVISNNNLFTKAGWTPFDGMKVKGKIMKVNLRGTTVFENGKILGEPEGKVVYPNE